MLDFLGWLKQQLLVAIANNLCLLNLFKFNQSHSHFVRQRGKPGSGKPALRGSLPSLQFMCSALPMLLFVLSELPRPQLRRPISPANCVLNLGKYMASCRCQLCFVLFRGQKWRKFLANVANTQAPGGLIYSHQIFHAIIEITPRFCFNAREK